MVRHTPMYTMTLPEEMIEVLEYFRNEIYCSYYNTALFTMRALPRVFMKWTVHLHTCQPQDLYIYLRVFVCLFVCLR